MAKALKIMTWNVQQLPALPNIPGVTIPPEFQPVGDPILRANQACDLILAMPARDAPDIITFNEVFHPLTREIFVARLKGKYQHRHKIFGSISLLPPRPHVDSGLMVFSKRAFQTLSNGKKKFFKAYSTSAAEDKFAEKGIGLVRVAGPRGPTFIGFTHMQAGANRAAIRKTQFAQINTAVRANASTAALRANTVVLGDLNVFGHINGPGTEVGHVFTNTAGTFGNLFVDGWTATAKPPDATAASDVGFTQENQDGTLRRLDFVCLPRGSATQPGLAAHHVSIAFRPPLAVADHWALMAVLHKPAPHCMPSTGFDVAAQPPAATAPSGQRLWTATANIGEEGMYWWIYVSAPGTYAVFADASLEFAAYKQSQLSKQLPDLGAVTPAQLPPAFAGALAGFGAGRKFSVTEPMFIRFRGATEAFAGAGGVAVGEM